MTQEQIDALLTPEQRSKIEGHLDSVFPRWRNRLDYFFPMAEPEKWKTPDNAMVLLLAWAFRSPLSKEEEKKAQQLAQGKSPGQGQGQSQEKGEGQGEGDGKGQGKGQGEGEEEGQDRPERAGNKGEHGKIADAHLRPDYLQELVAIRESEIRSKYSYTFSDSEVDKFDISNALATVFKRRLLARARDVYKQDREFGELDEDCLVGAVRGDRDIFFDVVPGHNRKVAITMCLDASGSMGGSVNCTAGRQSIAARNIVKALDMVRVPTMMLAYDNDVHWLRGWNERGNLDTPKGSGGTDAPNAMKAAMSLISKRNEPRKIILMISDGDLNESNMVHQGLVQECEMRGIERYAIIIGQDDRSADLRQAFNATVHTTHNNVESDLYGLIDDLFNQRI